MYGGVEFSKFHATKCLSCKLAAATFVGTNQAGGKKTLDLCIWNILIYMTIATNACATICTEPP
jgi:hypothetical protein